LPPSEYLHLTEMWDRKLRLLSRKLHTVHSGEEEALDTRLVAVRDWLHSIHFLEPMADWKLPGASLRKFTRDEVHFELAYNFGMSFYVDDIKMEHFSRQGRIISDVLMDAEEVFKREGIDIV
jgi:hypothetical protein